jgi:hypothetical protein
MKTKNLFRIIFLIVAVIGLTFSGCRKDKNSEPSDESSSLQQLSADEESFESAIDETMDDVNNYLSGDNLKSTGKLPCNATIDSTAVVNDSVTIYITYNGLNCNSTRFRTGQVEIKKQVGMHWNQQGATVQIKHVQFSITRVSTQKKIILNSLKEHTNVTGGLLRMLGNGLSTIVHHTQGRVAITFDDGTTKSWTVDRQKTYTGIFPNNLVMTVNGLGSPTSTGFENILIWGTNRQGENFYTKIIEPVVHRQVCDWNPCSGIKQHLVPGVSKSATITFGYDNQNQPVTGDECPVKYKLNWQKNNNSGTVYLRL